MSRKTEQAEQRFQAAASVFWRKEDQNVGAAVHADPHYVYIADGLAILAVAIRDIYDKLEAIHSEVRTLAERK